MIADDDRDRSLTVIAGDGGEIDDALVKAG